MAGIRELRRRYESMLVSPPRVDEGVGPPDPWRSERIGQPFSVFDPVALERALSLADRWMALAAAQPGTRGLTAAASDAEEVRRSENPRLVEHALLVFLTHYDEAARLPIPSLLERHPERFPSRAGMRVDEAGDPESRLDYWRLDPLANQHHEHWHVVYPSSGVPSGTQDRVVKKRHGELFVYMHRQMLARYDAERLSLGLPRVRPYDDYRKPIAEAFTPPGGEYNPRPANQNPHQLVRDFTVALEGARDRVIALAEAGVLPQGTALDSDRYGDLLEASGGWREPGRAGLHNEGHGMLGALSPGNPDNTAMNDTASAIKDPVFHRWHRHIDDLHYGFEQNLPVNDFSDAPPVSFPDGAVQLCFTEQVPGFGPGAEQSSLSSWASSRFGGRRWAAEDDPALTERLETTMTTSPNMGPDAHLDHRDFGYVIRIQNTSGRRVGVTLRIFLVPEEFAADRRAWIEMDKFPATLGPRVKAVVARWGGLSSVVQKPVHRPPSGRREPITSTADGGAWQDPNYCNCGWPFHLLLPRGTQDGLACQLLVLATDAATDQVIQDRPCGSLSFCGAKDVEYPDTRAMGYPFDRRFASGTSPAQALGALANVAIRPVLIQHGPTG